MVRTVCYYIFTFSSYKCKREREISFNSGNFIEYKLSVISLRIRFLFPVKAAIDNTNSSGTPSATPSNDLHEEPLRVVIFTKDTSSLLDTNQAAHQRGIDAFWENVLGDFANGKVQSIQIVVVMGDTMVVRTTNERDDISISNGVGYGGGEDEENQQDHEQEQGQGQENVDKNSTDDNSDNTNTSSVDSNQSEMDSVEKLSGIVKTIEYYIQTKIEEDFKANRSRIQFDTKSETCARMDISLTTVDNTVGFHSLCQKWSREMVAVIENNDRRLPTLCFQLPETSDFDACEISFLASYKCMPFPLNSSLAKNLYADLELLSRAKVEVLQLVPIASIDASLIYGVAIGLKAALEDNEDEHQEKILLVQSLLKNLVAKDCALLIRSKGPDDEGGLFHSSGSQYFLFIPEFVLSKDGPASNNGVLHRMASIDHILDEANDMDALTLSHRQEEEDIPVDNNPFSEYIEASLDCLDCSPLNPWFQYSLDITGASNPKRVTWKEEKENSVSKCASEEQIINRKGWTDESGIGSLVDEVRDENNEKENEKGHFTSSKERKATHPTGLKVTEDILDDVEDGDDELMIDSDDELMVDSSAVTQDSKRQHNKSIIPKPKNQREECAEMEWSGSDDSSSLGGSVGDSDSSSNDSTSFGTFDYTH